MESSNIQISNLRFVYHFSSEYYVEGIERVHELKIGRKRTTASLYSTMLEGSERT